jgi:hypothetical protein
MQSQLCPDGAWRSMIFSSNSGGWYIRAGSPLVDEYVEQGGVHRILYLTHKSLSCPLWTFAPWESCEIYPPPSCGACPAPAAGAHTTTQSRLRPGCHQPVFIGVRANFGGLKSGQGKLGSTGSGVVVWYKFVGTAANVPSCWAYMIEHDRPVAWQVSISSVVAIF